ncbi:MAG: redox-regulated ATPase YchF [Mycoplasma sp.]
MGLSTGIIGLPNVGKSTLFNAITNSQIEAANYPFATIEPNVGIVNLPDERLELLSQLVSPEKTVYSTVKFVDIAGLVKGASKGEGLGNKFLQNIADVDAIIHVVRCFEDADITHVHNKVDPLGDIQVIEMELILSDIEVIENRINRIKKTALAGTDKKAKYEYDTLMKVYKTLTDEKFASKSDLSEEELQLIKNFNLITLKPYMFVANISETEVANPKGNKHFLALEEYAKNIGIDVVPISAKIECEISQLKDQDKEEFMNMIGIQQPGLTLLIKASFKLLNLSTYFTVGKKEVRSWVFKSGSFAPVCAGIIHSDFERGFIKVEVMKCEDLLELKSEAEVKKAGKLRLEGKTYIVQDGDICTFKFNV